MSFLTMFRISLLSMLLPPVAIIFGYFISNYRDLLDWDFWDAPAIFAAVYLAVATMWIIYII